MVVHYAEDFFFHRRKTAFLAISNRCDIDRDVAELLLPLSDAATPVSV